jgi:hypothetical protein
MSLGKGSFRIREKSPGDRLSSGSIFLGMRSRKAVRTGGSWHESSRQDLCHDDQLLESLRLKMVTLHRRLMNKSISQIGLEYKKTFSNHGMLRIFGHARSANSTTLPPSPPSGRVSWWLRPWPDAYGTQPRPAIVTQSNRLWRRPPICFACRSNSAAPRSNLALAGGLTASGRQLPRRGRPGHALM